MREADLVLARPAHASQLVLLFHGVGSSAADLAPLGTALAKACPSAFVVSVEADHASTLGRGREWFSVSGVTEENRAGRIAAAMPLFREAVRHWQETTGVGAADTVLVGFSQGAIMSLESTQVPGDPAPAGRVVALAGRLARAARQAPPGLRFHLVHGEQDGVMPPALAVNAARELRALGAELTLDLLPGLGHGIDARVLRLVIGYLGGHPPVA